MGSMRAAVVDSAGRVTLGQRPLPEPGEGQVRVRVEACGICGSDLHFLESGGFPAGHTPGHEMCGRIDAAGAGVGAVSDGRVVVEPIRSCGSCRWCLAGERQICPEARLLGIHEAGGLAEAVIVPASRVHAVDEALDPRLCALAEPVAVSVHAMRKAGVAAGDRVLVLGAGTIGLTTTIAARALGAEVWQSARHPHQAEHAERCGAQHVLPESEAHPDRIGATLAQARPDVVIETVGGAADTLVAGARAIRPGGTIVVLGVFTSSPPIDAFSMLVREARLVFSNCYGGDARTGDFATAVGILGEERERLETLLSHALPLSQVSEAFDLAADKKRGTVKVTVTL